MQSNQVYKHNQPRATYRTIETRNASGQVTEETLGGNTVTTAQSIEACTGRLQTLRARNSNKKHQITTRIFRPARFTALIWTSRSNVTNRQSFSTANAKR